MNLSGFLLTIVATVAAPVHAQVPPTQIPSDISVTFTATPSTNLVPGQTVAFTVTATNLGPAPVSDLVLLSSLFVDQFDLSHGSVNCPGFVGSVLDAQTGFFYYFNWYVAGRVGDVAELAVNQTIKCEFTLALSTSAPTSFQFSFGIPNFYTDINSINDTGIVTLQRASALPAAPIPLLSTSTLVLLTGLVAVTAAVVRCHRMRF